MSKTRPNIERVKFNLGHFPTLDINKTIDIGDNKFCRIAISWGANSYFLFETFMPKKHNLELKYMDSQDSSPSDWDSFCKKNATRRVLYCILCCDVPRVGGQPKEFILEYFFSPNEGVPLEFIQDRDSWIDIYKLDLSLENEPNQVRMIDRAPERGHEDPDGDITGLFFSNMSVDSVILILACYYDFACRYDECVEINSPETIMMWGSYLGKDRKITKSKLLKFWNEKTTNKEGTKLMSALTKHDRSAIAKAIKVISSESFSLEKLILEAEELNLNI